jgi:hypothetical protein
MTFWWPSLTLGQGSLRFRQTQRWLAVQAFTPIQTMLMAAKSSVQAQRSSSGITPRSTTQDFL